VCVCVCVCVCVWVCELWFVPHQNDWNDCIIGWHQSCEMANCSILSRAQRRHVVLQWVQDWKNDVSVTQSVTATATLPLTEVTRCRLSSYWKINRSFSVGGIALSINALAVSSGRMDASRTHASRITDVVGACPLRVWLYTRSICDLPQH